MAEQMKGMTDAERETLEVRAHFMSAMDRSFGGVAEPTDFAFWPEDPTVPGSAETLDPDQTAVLAEVGARTHDLVTASQVTVGGLARATQL